jgi:uridine kinase
MMEDKSKAIIVMGVSGAGKTSIAELLASRLQCAFVEGDKLHPEANVKKMAEGTPLTDEDRWPWLEVIGENLHSARSRNEDIVVTCSALKKVYRDCAVPAANRSTSSSSRDRPNCWRIAWAIGRAISCRPRCCRASWRRWKARKANQAL